MLQPFLRRSVLVHLNYFFTTSSLSYKSSLLSLKQVKSVRLCFPCSKLTSNFLAMNQVQVESIQDCSSQINHESETLITSPISTVASESASTTLSIDSTTSVADEIIKTDQLESSKSVKSARLSQPLSTTSSSGTNYKQQLPDNLTSNYNKLKGKLEGKNDNLLSKLRELHSGCKKLNAIAPSFDLDENNPGNGFRSFIKIIATYFAHLVSLLEKAPSRKRMKLLYEYEMVASGFIRIMSFFEMVSKRPYGLEWSDYHEENSIDQKILTAMLGVEEKEILPFLTNIQNFWLIPSIRDVMNNVIASVIIWKTTSVLKMPEVMMSKSLKASCLARYALHGTTDQVKSVWGFGEEFLNRSMIGIRHSISSGSSKSIYLPRQKEWILNNDGLLTHQFMGVDESTIPVESATEALEIDLVSRNNSVISSSSKKSINGNNNLNDVSEVDGKKRTSFQRLSKKRRKSSSGVANSSCYGTGNTEQSVRCAHIRYGSKRTSSPENSLIFHIHGGGYIALSPKSHEQYLRIWSKKLGVPVISVDYGLSPESKYPSALQEILDCYLFLTSGSAKVKELLGFNPENIVICGDSAGGNMSLSLALILNDINQHVKNVEGLETKMVQMPVSLCIQYPCANPTIACHSASRLFTAFDPLLSIACVYACAGGYLDVGAKDYPEKPWFRNPEVFHEVVEKILIKKKDPYVNILSFKRFHELCGVKLYVQASEFDPLLDDAVAISKAWKGPVTLDIVEGVVHGFMAFLDFSAEARTALDMIVERLRSALDLKDGVAPLDIPSSPSSSGSSSPGASP